MISTTRKQILAASFALVALLAGALPVAAQSSHYQLRMVNDAGFSFYRLYMSSSNNDGWGSDQLGSNVLRDGSSFTLTDVSRGYYDLKFVDRAGTSCVVQGVRMDTDRYINITPNWLREWCH